MRFSPIIRAKRLCFPPACVFFVAVSGQTAVSSYRVCPLLLPIAALLIYVLCSAFTPLVLLRYYGALFLAMPVIVGSVLCPERQAA